jgi:hypothetical protein
MGPALLAAMAILSVAEGQLAYTAGVRTEARRSWAEPSQGQIQGLGFELLPSGGLSWATGGLTAAIEYQPRLWSAADPWKPGAYHRGLASLAATPTRELKLKLGLTGAYGDADAATLAATAVAGPSAGQARPVGQLTRARQQDLGASLGAELIVLPTVLATATAGYYARGGADATARATSPLEQGPRAGLSVAWRTDALNTLATEASYDRRSHSAPPGGAAATPTAWSAVLGEAWTSQLGPELAVKVGAGGALTSGSRGVAPAAEAGLTLTQRTGWQFRGGAGLSPFIDPISTRVYALASGNLGATGPLTTWATLGVDGSAGVATSGPQKGQYFTRGDLGLLFPLAPELQLGVGARLLSQHGGAQPATATAIATPIATNLKQWTTFVALSWNHRGTL